MALVIARPSALPVLLVLASVPACSKQAPPAPAAPSDGPAAGAKAAAPAPAGPSAYVASVSALRRAPSDAARVPGAGKKEVPNALAVLLRGEQVTVLEARQDWARVRTSGDTEGWLARGALLEGEGISEATVLVQADVFDRPDLLAANARRKVEPGTLLLVVRTKPPFAEVNVASGPNAWILSERLASGEREVSVAKLVEKARWLKRAGKEEDAKQILALARQQFAGVPLVDVLAVELGEAPPPPAAPDTAALPVPASAPAPAPPQPAIDPTRP